MSYELHFDVSSGLKRVLGRELITDDEVAIFELVKNSFDAGADKVELFFDGNRVVVADNGIGMDYDDLTEKWLFVAYSAKREENKEDFRDKVAQRAHYAGSKGIGRFSSDRLGQGLILQTRPKSNKTGIVHRLDVDWSKFDESDKKRFEKIPVTYAEQKSFILPVELVKFAKGFTHGTVIEINDLRLDWSRDEIKNLKASLAKLINPFGSDVDRFQISICAPAELAEDEKIKKAAKDKKDEPFARDIINGRVGNFIFEDLEEKTTFIDVSIEDGHIETILTDRTELIYHIRESNPYKELEGSDFRCRIFYLNHSAKITFARRVGLPSVQFGSVFLFRNDFRVFPIGENEDDWFGFSRRKQQGYARYLGTREVIGRVDVYGDDGDFQEASSRNQGLIDTEAVKQLRRCVMDRCLKRLERYVVPVLWVDRAESNTGDLSRLLTEPGKARVAGAVAGLVDNDDIELFDYSKRLIGILNERSSDFEESIVSLRAIANKTDDKELIEKLDEAEKRFEELKLAEVEARKVADQERKASEKAMERALQAEAEVKATRAEIEVERRRSHFLESVASLDVKTILNLHHQVTIYSVDVNQQIENLITKSQGKESIPREDVMKAIEQIAFQNRRIQAISRFAAQATFSLDSGKITTDLAEFIEDYVNNIARQTTGARIKVEVKNDHPGLNMKFNPIDVSIIIDNLVSNARRARAPKINFTIEPLTKNGLSVDVSDNGKGFAAGVDPDRMFDMGYTTTHGSGLGLYHVQQVLGQMGGSIELAENQGQRGTSFKIKITKSSPK